MKLQLLLVALLLAVLIADVSAQQVLSLVTTRIVTYNKIVPIKIKIKLFRKIAREKKLNCNIIN